MANLNIFSKHINYDIYLNKINYADVYDNIIAFAIEDFEIKAKKLGKDKQSPEDYFTTDRNGTITIDNKTYKINDKSFFTIIEKIVASSIDEMYKKEFVSYVNRDMKISNLSFQKEYEFKNKFIINLYKHISQKKYNDVDYEERRKIIINQRYANLTEYLNSQIYSIILCMSLDAKKYLSTGYEFKY